MHIGRMRESAVANMNILDENLQRKAFADIVITELKEGLKTAQLI